MAIRTNKGFDFIISAIIVAYCIFINPLEFYGQDPENSDENSKTIKIVEQALKNYDSKKQNEEEKFKTLLNSRLEKKTKTWIADMENTRYKQLDTIFEQDWDKQPRTAILLPASFG